MRDAFGVSKGLPPYGHVPGIGRVKVNGMPHKDTFDVTDAKDVRRLIPRARIKFVKSKKLPKKPAFPKLPTNPGAGANWSQQQLPFNLP